MAREWIRIMCETLDDSDGELATHVEALFAIFYVDDGYIASKDAEFPQEALDILIEMFKRVGLATNTKKTLAMVCTPGNIRLQLPTDSYRRLREGVATGEEGKRAVVCHMCEAGLQARSIRLHLKSNHDIYQQVVVADYLLEAHPSICYEAERVGRKVPIKCPFPGCPGKLSSAYMLRWHFRDLHPARSSRRAGHGPGKDKSSRRITLHQRSAPCSTRWLCSRFSFTAGDMEPHKDRTGAVRGVSHQGCLPYG